MTQQFNMKAVQEALQDIFEIEDYDLYRAIKFGEEEEFEDAFPKMAEDFVQLYRIYNVAAQR